MLSCQTIFTQSLLLNGRIWNPLKTGGYGIRPYFVVSLFFRMYMAINFDINKIYETHMTFGCFYLKLYDILDACYISQKDDEYDCQFRNRKSQYREHQARIKCIFMDDSQCNTQFYYFIIFNNHSDRINYKNNRWEDCRNFWWRKKNCPYRNILWQNHHIINR